MTVGSGSGPCAKCPPPPPPKAYGIPHRAACTAPHHAALHHAVPAQRVQIEEPIREKGKQMEPWNVNCAPCSPTTRTGCCQKCLVRRVGASYNASGRRAPTQTRCTNPTAGFPPGGCPPAPAHSPRGPSMAHCSAHDPRVHFALCASQVRSSFRLIVQFLLLNFLGTRCHSLCVVPSASASPLPLLFRRLPKCSTPGSLWPSCWALTPHSSSTR